MRCEIIPRIGADLKVVLRHVCPMVRVQLVDRYQRIGILLASSVEGHCFASIGIANDYGRTARGSFVDAIQRIGQRPSAFVVDSCSNVHQAFLKIFPGFAWRPIMRLRFVLDVNGCHPGRLHHVVTVYERVVRIPVGPHHGREHSGDNTPLSDCLIRQD